MEEKELPQSLEGCHQLIKQLLEITDALVARTKELTYRIEKLERENKALKEQLRNNSSNSSKPPSSDQKKNKKKTASQKKSGGKPGHKGHTRQLLESDKVDDIVICRLPTHCECGGRIKLKDGHHRHQVYELPEIRLHVT